MSVKSALRSSASAPERMSQGKARLILSHNTAFFGSLACSLDFVEEPTLNPPTMATDGTCIYYHPQFVADHDDDEILFVICHEVLHVALVHMFRMRGLDHRMANIAADIAINEILCVEGIGRMPKCGIRDTDLYTRGGGTMEGIYSIIQQKQQEKRGQGKPCQQGQPGQGKPQSGQGQPQQGQGQPGDGLPDLMDALIEPGQGKTDAERAMIEADVRLKVAGAMQAAEMRGNLPGSLKRLLSEALDVKTPWQALLREFFTEKSNEYRSWAKPNRRFAAQGIYMPGRDGHRMGKVCISADASGSINQKMFDVFGAEANKIIADTKPKLVYLSYFDTRITNESEIDPSMGDEISLKVQAGGGTNFAPIMPWCDEKEDPSCLVILTDGHCSSFGNEPDCPVLWAVLEGNKKFDPPFGTVLHIDG